eukprot:3081267-Pyramimonas_sp.AAC.1
MAARYRAARTSGVFEKLIRWQSEIIGSDDYVVANVSPSLSQQPPLFQLDRAVQLLGPIPRAPEDYKTRNFEAAALRAIEVAFSPHAAREALIPRLKYSLGQGVARPDMRAQLFSNPVG